MNIGQYSIRQIFNFARHRWRSFVLGVFLSIPVAVITSATWLNASGRDYSFKSLFTTAFVVFVLVVWIVCLITGNFLNWIKTKDLNLNWKDYIRLGIALISLIAAVYYGWSGYGGKKVLNRLTSVYEVEIMSLGNTMGSICLLEIKNQYGEKIRTGNSSIFGISLTGDWIAGSGDCQYLSQGSSSGTLKFDYVGKMGEIFQFLFEESPKSGKAFIYINGEETAGVDLFAEQEGSKLITVPIFLSHITMLIWNTIGTTGWFAALVVLSMILTLLLKNSHIPREILALVKVIESKPWISLVPVVIAAVFMFWPRGSSTSPDVAYYLSLAKNLYHGNGYVNPDLSPNIYRGPVLPLLISFSYVLFGESFRSALITERVFWFLTILVSYFLGKQLYSHRVGFLAAFFILTASVINETFVRIWTDGPLTFGILALQLMVWQAFKNQQSSKWYVLMGVLIGMTYLLKQTVIFIAPLPLLIWVIFSEHRTLQTFKKLLIFYIVFSFFYFGWDIYVYLVGGSSGQITGTIKTGINFVSYISRGLPLANTGQNPIIQEGITKNSSAIAFLDILYKFYTKDILMFFRIAVVFPIALGFTLYQAVVKKIKSDIFLITGLFLYTPLILLQVVVDFGFRQNLYFYCVVLLCIAAMLDRIFSKISSQAISSSITLMVAASLIFIQVSGNNYVLRDLMLIKNQKTLDYFSSYQQIATWVDNHIDSDEIILANKAESNVLHILTAGNKQFDFINTCMGEISASPAVRCKPPYISFWVYQGTTDPDEPRDFLQGISETSLLSTIREKDIKHIFVTPTIHSLYYYLKIHPDFEEIDIIDNVAIFRIVHPAKPISNYPNMKWMTCIGEGTPEYLKNLKETDRARYEIKLREQVGPWMGLNRQDLENIINWQGCQFKVNFPGIYSMP